MSSYLLDLIVNDIHVSNDVTLANKPVWAMFRVDGSNQPFSTPQYEIKEEIVINYPVRLFLNIEDLSMAHLYVNFCTYSDNSERMISLAVSRVKLKSFPVGRPRKFSFPLMSTVNTAITVATISITATLSTFIPSYQTLPSNGSMNSSGWKSSSNQGGYGSYASSPY